MIFKKIENKTKKILRNKKRKQEDEKKYNEDKKRYILLNKRPDFDFSIIYERAFIKEWREAAGNPGVYFWQDMWGANRVVSHEPREHYDIGSRIDGFISHMLLFPNIRTHLIDIRPLPKTIPGIEFVQADATNLDGIKDESIESISALCSLEHFGLGRYGDPIDPEACFKAFFSVQRVVRKGGRIYISLPVGETNHVCFNEQRVFTPDTIIKEFDMCDIEEFSIIDLDLLVPLKENVNIKNFKTTKNVTGLFVFIKK